MEQQPVTSEQANQQPAPAVEKPKGGRSLRRKLFAVVKVDTPTSLNETRIIICERQSELQQHLTHPDVKEIMAIISGKAVNFREIKKVKLF